ncbi:MAG: NAD(P)H-dependent oxidoreductase [Anaerovoracaceae bacterium]
MNILFLNGSPKGKNSVTIKTAQYIEKRYPANNYTYLNIGQQIKSLEKDFTKAEAAITNADLIVFCYPVYTFIAPSQVHRFIEILKEKQLPLSQKYCAQITTSKHFYDVTALKFIEENAYDLGFRYLSSLSADMDDLQSESGQFEADCFFDKILFDIKNDIFKQGKPSANRVAHTTYISSLDDIPKKSDKDIVLVTNASQSDENLNNMILDFKHASAYPVREINIRDFPFKGGCLGCMQCAISEKCVYNDNFEDLLRNEIQNADGIILAFTIENHFTHSSMKCYDDRQFCNGHRTLTTGKATGYIISGNYSQEANLQMIVEARANVSGMYFCGVAGDEGSTTNEISNLAKTLDFALSNSLKQPPNFYGVGGSKIFRDLVYLMQGLMQADHKFYKANGIYDFPHKKKGMMFFMKCLGLMMKSPKLQKKMQSKMSEFICAPYQKVIDNVKPKK